MYSAQFKEFLLSTSNPPAKVTIKNYLSDLNKFLRWFSEKYNQELNLSSVSFNVIEDFKKESLTKYSASSVDRNLSTLRKFFHFAKLEGYISHSPFEEIRDKSAQESAKIDPFNLKGFKNHLYVFNASHLTIKNYVIDVKQFLKWAEEVLNNPNSWEANDSQISTKINSALIETYKQRLLNEVGLSPVSVNRKLSSLRRYISWANQEGIIRSSVQVMNEARPNEISNLKIKSAQATEIGNWKLEIGNSQTYSSFPPLRLLQKTKSGLMKIFDGIVTYPLVEAKEKLDLLIWNSKGRPVFEQAKNLKLKAPSSTLYRQIKNIPKSFYAPTLISTKNFPFHKKVIHHLKHSRPEWYLKYQSYSFVSYLRFAVLMFFISVLAYAVYNNINPNKPQPATLAALPSAPLRILSFQGRLTDAQDNPIKTKTSLRMGIYSNETASGGALLWQEVVEPTPDEDGIFNVILGKNTAIPQSLFAQNSGLWLGVTVGQTSELKPRQQVATVAFAANAETLQGLPPITNSTSTSNVILALNSSGNLTIGGSASPVFQATGGNFTVAGKTVILLTNTGSNGDIRIAPDGQGKIDIRKPLVNNGLDGLTPSALGAVEVNDLFSILATSSGQSAFTLNQNGTGPVISASVSGLSVFTLSNNGDLQISGRYNGLTIQDGIVKNGAWNASTIGVEYGGTALTSYATGDLIYASGSTTLSKLAIGTSVQCLIGGTTPAWGSCASGTPTNYWTSTNGALYPINSSLDFLLGATSTASARFAVLNIDSGVTTASISAASGATYLTASGILSTTNSQSLTLGDSTTGNVIFNQGGNIGISTTTPQALFDVKNTLLVNSTGKIFFPNTAGDNAILYSTPSTGQIGSTTTSNASFCLISNGTSPGVPGWAGCNTGTGDTFWDMHDGALSSNNNTADFLIGGTATLSAKFAILNINFGIPVATLSADSGNSGFYTTADGTVATIRRKSLILGNSSSYDTTGNVLLNPSGVGNVGIGTIIPDLSLEINSSTGNNLRLTYNDSNGNASSYTNFTLGSDGDLTIDSSGGNINLSDPTAIAGQLTLSTYNANNNVLYATVTTGVVAGATTSTTGLCLTSGASTPAWANCNSSGIDTFWNQTSGALYPNNSSVDFLIGGQASTSAKFAVLNINSGTPTASVSSGTQGLSLIGDGTIQTTRNNSLTIGGDSTGNITLSPNNGSGGIVNVNAPTINTNATTLALFDTTTTTLNIGGAATTLNLGASTGTATIANDTLTLSNATVFNMNGANPTIAGTSTGTLTLFNTNLTTVNAFGAATTLNLGASTGTATIANAAVTLSNATTLTASSLATFTTSANLAMNSTSTLTATSLVTFTTSASLLLGTTTLTLDSNSTINGGSASNDDLTLQGTSNATRTTSYVIIQPNGGNVGIGTTSPKTTIDATSSAQAIYTSLDGSSILGSYRFGQSITDSSTTTIRGFAIESGIDMVTDASKTINGFTSSVVIPPSSTANLSSVNLRALNGNIVYRGTGTIGTSIANAQSVQNTSTGTLTNAYVLQATGLNTNASGTIGTLRLLDLANLSNAGTITNTYGLYIGDITTGTQSNTPFSIYASDTSAYNYFAGNTGIGTATPSTFKLEVAGNVGPSVGDTYDLGSSARKWKNIWGVTANFDSFTATNATISGTTSEDFTINSDNVSNDIEDASLTFEVGSPTTNPRFTWTSSTKLLGANAPFKIQVDPSITMSGTAALIVDQYQNQDIFTASASGSPRFKITNGGSIQMSAGQSIDTLAAGTLEIGTTNATTITLGRSGQGITLPAFTGNNAVLYGTAGTGVLAQANTSTTGLCMVSAASTPAWANCNSSGIDTFWNQTSGALYPNNSSVDFLIGGQASTSAKFAVLNINSGTPTASVSSGTQGLSLIGDGTIQTTRNNSLTVGGDSTGNIYLMPRSGAGTIYGDTVSNGDLTLEGTSSTTKTTSYINLQPNGGNVGIGTTSPLAALDIRSINTQGLYVMNPQAAASTAGGGISGFTTSIPTAADQRLGFYTLGYHNGTTARNSVSMEGFSSQAFVDGTAQGSYLVFKTTPNGSATRAEAMRIDQNGNVGIGTTTPTALLDVSGTASISGQLVLYGTPTLQSDRNSTLILGGDTTGNITLSPNNGTGGIVNVNAPTINTNATSLALFNTTATTVNAFGAATTLNLGPGTGITTINNDASISGTLTMGGAIQPATGNLTLNYKSAPNTWAAAATINTVGNLGIGTTAPTFKLEVHGTGAYPIAEGGGAQTSGFARFYDDTTNAMLDIGGAPNSSPWGMWIQTHNIGNAGTIPLLLNPLYGNVGINTTSPTAVLDVAGAASVGGQFTFRSGTAQIQSTVNQNLTIGGDTTGNIFLMPLNGSGTVYGTTATNGDLTLEGTSSTTKTTSYINLQPNGGNVGIGTTSPISKLSVTNTVYTDAPTAAVMDIGGIGAIAGAGQAEMLKFIRTRTGVSYANVASITLGKYGAASDTNPRSRMDFNLKNTAGNGSDTDMTAMTIQGDGLVGIGTISPTALLDVAGTASVSSTLTMGGAIQPATGNLTLNYKSAPNTWAAAVTINTVGNIGIGTTAPGQLLDVEGDKTSAYITSIENTNVTAAHGLYIKSGGVGSGTNLLTLDAGANTRFIVRGDGSVGINTTTPTALLDVSGTASISGQLVLYGTPTLQSDRNSTLILGGDTTGNITLSPNNGTGGIVNVNAPTINTNATSLALFNTTATTVNAFGAATTLSLGASTGTATIANATLTLSNATTLTASSLATFTTSANLAMNSTSTLTATSLATFTTSASLALGGATTLTFTADNATIYGSDIANGDLTLEGTSNATKTTSYVILQPTTGSVGINTTSPTAILDVAGAASVGGQLSFRTGSGQIQTTRNETLTVGGDSTGNIFLMPINGSGTVYGGTATNGDLTIEGTSSTTKTTSYINLQPNGGNVGIGTTAPSYPLEISKARTGDDTLLALGTTGVGAIADKINILFKGPGTGGVIADRAKISAIINNPSNQLVDLAFYISSAGSLAEAMRITSDGSVGINTTTPTALLDVSGTASISGQLVLYGTPTLQSDRNSTLTLGGDTTGNITLKPNNGTGGILNLNAPTINTNATSLDLFNTTATTVNAFGAATTLNLGPGTGITTINNDASVSGTLTMGGAIQPATGNLTLNYKSAPNTWAAAATINTVGSVGIGTTAPDHLLSLTKTQSSGTTANMLKINFDANWGLKLVQNYVGAGDIKYELKQVYNTVTYDVLAFKSGNVGINTTTPTALLDVAGAASVGGQLSFRSGTAQIQSSVNNSLTVGGDSTGNIFLMPLNGSGTVYGTTASNGDLTLEGTSSTTKTTSYINLQPNGGNVGIGTTAPDNALDIKAADYAHLVLTPASGANKTWISMDTGNFYMDINRRTSNGVFGDTSATHSRIRMNSANGAGYISFASSNTNNTAAPEIMRIAGSGNVGIGDTTPDAFLEVLGTTEQMRLSYTDNTVDARFTVASNGNLTIDGSTDGTGSETLTLTGYSTLTATSLTTLSLGTSATINAAATDLNLQADGTADVNIAGGSGATGCTISNATGNIACSGGLSGVTTASMSGTLTLGGSSGIIQPATGNLTLNYKSAPNTWAAAATINTVGNLGIGTTAPAAKLDVYSIYQTGASAGTVYNVKSVIDIGWGGATASHAFYGQVRNTLNYHPTGSGAVFYAVGATSVLNSYITDAYGLYIEAQKTTYVTNGWGVYSAGASDKNYFAGNVGIGTTAPGYGIDVEKATGVTEGKFGSSLPIYIIAPDPNIGFNAYYNSGFKFGKGSVSGVHYGGSLSMTPTSGAWSFYTSNATGNADAAMTMVNVLSISQAGAVTGGTYNSQTISNAANFTGTVGITGALTVTADATAKSLIVSGGGSYVAGAIYSDVNYGMIFRAKQAAPAAQQFLWTNSAGAASMSMDNSNNLNISGDLAISGGNITTAVTADSTLTVTGTFDPNGAVTLPTTGISGAGAGSGLDADKLDTYSSASFAGSYGAVTDIHAVGGQNLYTFFNSNTTATTNCPLGGTCANWVQGIQFPLAGNGAYRQLLVSEASNLYFESEGGGVWGGWRKLWDSGNDGSGSTLDADLLDGANLSASAGNSTVVQRTSNGYIYANYFNMTANDVGAVTDSHIAVETSSDGYLRWQTPAEFVAAEGNHIVGDQDGGRSNFDFNAQYVASGFYNFADAPTNGPGSSYAQLIVAKGVDTGLQIVGGYTSPMYYRGWYGSGSNFTAWRRIVDTDDLTNGRVRMKDVGCESGWNSSCDAGNNGRADYADTATSVNFNSGLTTGSSPTFQEVYANGWLRTNAAQGWYNSTYAVGWYATQAGRVDTYNNAGIYTAGTITSGLINSQTISAAANFTGTITMNNTVFSTVSNTSGECDTPTAGTGWLCIAVNAGAASARLTGSGVWTTAGAQTPSGNPDVAEAISVIDSSIESGDIVSAQDSGSRNVSIHQRAIAIKANSPYSSIMVGAITEDPGILIGTESMKHADGLADNQRGLTIAGRIPVKVSTINGEVKVGDSITSSEIPGIGMKATKAGEILGRVMTDYVDNNSTQSTKLVNGTWQTQNVRCSQNEANCYNYQKVLVLINPSFYDPDVQLADSGDLTIGPSVEQLASSFEIKRNGESFTRIGAFSEIVSAKIRIGSAEIYALTAQTITSVTGNFSNITTNSLAIVTDNITIAGQNIQDFITNIVDQRIAQNGGNGTIISPLETDGDNIALKLKTNDDKSKFVVKNASGSAVATIDGSGNASISGSLNVEKDATISGTLRVKKIIADEIEGLNINTATLSAQNITNNYYISTHSATSGQTPSANPFYDPNATSSANGQWSISTGSATLGDLTAQTATFTQGLMSFGPTSFFEASVADRLFVGSQLSIANNSMNVLGANLELQPLKQGGIRFLSGLVEIDTEGNLKVQGNAYFAKDVKIEGTLSANIIAPIPGKDLIFELPESSGSAIYNSALIINNSSQSGVLSINSRGDLAASGAGTFGKLNLNIVQEVLALSDTEVIATGSAGVSEIKNNQIELTIRNPLVTDKSLIYVTPKTSTPNQSVYLIRQVPGVSFTVGISSPVSKKVPFNWIIIN